MNSQIDTFEAAYIEKMELTIREHEDTIQQLQYEAAQMNIIAENSKEDLKKSEVKNITLTRANKKTE